MKTLVFLLLILVSVAAFGQKPEAARGNYAENGKLIGLTNLSALSDCQVFSGEGVVKKVKTEMDRAFVQIEDKKNKVGIKFEIPLERLEREERDAIFRDLVKKSYVLRMSGYACGVEMPVAFSVDRVY